MMQIVPRTPRGYERAVQRVGAALVYGLLVGALCVPFALLALYMVTR